METMSAPVIETATPVSTTQPNTSWSGLSQVENSSRNTSDNLQDRHHQQDRRHRNRGEEEALRHGDEHARIDEPADVLALERHDVAPQRRPQQCAARRTPSPRA